MPPAAPVLLGEGSSQKDLVSLLLPQLPVMEFPKEGGNK